MIYNAAVNLHDEMINVREAIRIVEDRIEQVNDEARRDVKFLRTERYHVHLLLSGVARSLRVRLWHLQFRYYAERGD